jgi:hypothetical protein
MRRPRPVGLVRRRGRAKVVGRAGEAAGKVANLPAVPYQLAGRFLSGLTGGVLPESTYGVTGAVLGAAGRAGERLGDLQLPTSSGPSFLDRAKGYRETQAARGCVFRRFRAAVPAVGEHLFRLMASAVAVLLLFSCGWVGCSGWSPPVG